MSNGSIHILRKSSFAKVMRWPLNRVSVFATSFLLVYLLMAGSSIAWADTKLSIYTGLPPVSYLVSQIAGDKADVEYLLKPGSTPETYNLPTRTIQSLETADLVFVNSTPFESKIELLLKGERNIKLLDENVTLLLMADTVEDIHGMDDDHDDDDHKNDHSHGDGQGHSHDILDKHTWLSPEHFKRMADTIYKALVKVDPDNANYYKANYENTVSRINETQKSIRSILKGTDKFLTVHPAWGYFAEEYDLKQYSLESFGTEPKPRELVELSELEGLTYIIIEPNFPEQTGKMLAERMNLTTYRVNPVNENWFETMEDLATAIAGK